MNAHTSAGARRPFGRYSQISGAIRITVHHGPMSQAAVAPADRAGVLATLRPGDAVEGVFACTRKERLRRAQRQPVPGGRAARPRRRRCRRGCSATPTCRAAASTAASWCACPGGSSASASRPSSSSTASSGAAGELDPAAFLPVAYRDLDELDGFLEHLAREVAEPGYRRLLERDAGRRGAARASGGAAPCTRAGHHAYLGGLLEHTVAVTTLAQELALGHPRLNSDLLLCAAIVHDIGKTREFTYAGATIERSDEGRLVGHIPIGLRLIRARAGGAARRAAPARARALRAVPPRPGRRRPGDASPASRRSRCAA